jgi:hypothetical protein
VPRIRSLKIGFFTNEILCELSPWHRLLFAGLWLLADREGRLEDRPRRIKATLFPYDEVNVDGMLTELADKGFVVRYTADGAACADGAPRYLAIPQFTEHQRPKTDEYVSVIPAPSSKVPRGISRSPRLDRDIGKQTETETETEGGTVAPKSRVEDFVTLWNAHTLPPVARCRDLTTSRKRHVKARMTERTLEAWGEVFERIQASAFCRGENDRGWRASFDWVIGSPDVAVKVLEGKYDDRVSHSVNTERLTPFEMARRAGLK